MGLTRTVAGSLGFDHFAGDTAANYDAYSGSPYVEDSYLKGCANHIVRKSISGVECVTLKGHGVVAHYLPGAALWANSPLDAAGDCDGYLNALWPNDLYLCRYDNIAEHDLATAGFNPGSNADSISRLYRAAGVIYAKYGLSAFTVAIQGADTTYAGALYGGAASWGAYWLDWFDPRTSHIVTVTGLPAGSSVVCSDGTTTATANASSGTATLDCGAVLFPLASVTVYSGTGGTGDVLATLTSGDLADMGGGDTFEYAGGEPPAAGIIGPVIGSRIIGSPIVRSARW